MTARFDPVGREWGVQMPYLVVAEALLFDDLSLRYYHRKKERAIQRIRQLNRRGIFNTYIVETQTWNHSPRKSTKSRPG
jgi:hypothetical protein